MAKSLSCSKEWTFPRFSLAGRTLRTAPHCSKSSSASCVPLPTQKWSPFSGGRRPGWATQWSRTIIGLDSGGRRRDSVVRTLLPSLSSSPSHLGCLGCIAPAGLWPDGRAGGSALFFSPQCTCFHTYALEMVQVVEEGKKKSVSPCSPLCFREIPGQISEKARIFGVRVKLGLA